MKNYLIFQFACYGDCLIATAVAHQLKHDEPESHITWAIASKYKSILNCNPHVDAVLELKIDPQGASAQEHAELAQWLVSVSQSGEYDEVIHLQIFNKHISAFHTTLRSTVFKLFGRPMTVDISPIVHLEQHELRNVEQFAKAIKLDLYKHVVIFECAPNSSQSRMTPQLALDIATRVSGEHKDICCILTSPFQIATGNDHIVSASSISFRENLCLANYCTLFVGCSSGITWLLTSAAAKRIPMIQLLERNSPIFAGVSYDMEINGLDNSHIIEMTEFSVSHVVNCVNSVLNTGVVNAKATFNQDYKPSIYHLKLSLRRLLNMQWPLSDLYCHAQEFVLSNKRSGNSIKADKLTMIYLICAISLEKCFFDSKAGLKAALVALWKFKRYQ